ncbi:MAG: cysteine--tRNA ligase, partial [Pseudomonadota bacterium]
MLNLYNSMGRRLEAFAPRDGEHVRMYVCGPTVYSFAHIGNARPAVVFDVLARVLRARFSRVSYARNITDVDDKIITAASAEGVSCDE